MSIIYALVARESTVLAEYTDKTGNFTTVTQSILEKITDAETKISYVYDTFMFHIVAEGGFVYLCMADQDFGRRVPFQFLNAVKDIFRAQFADRGRTAIAYGLNKQFAPILKQEMERAPEQDRVSQVKQEIEEVKGVMVHNIEKVLQRGDRIELLVDKTEALDNQAQTFKKRATKLKSAMWWKNAKLMIILGIVIVAIITVIVVVAVEKNKKK